MILNKEKTMKKGKKIENIKNINMVLRCKKALNFGRVFWGGGYNIFVSIVKLMKNKSQYVIIPLIILSFVLAYVPFPLGIFKVKEVSAATPTGGTITYDGDYTVHTFLSSGTFTVPTGQSGNVEYLVVAGGGGGGGAPGGGGGGAGGMRHSASPGTPDHAVTAQAYTITVGDGGASGTLLAKGDSGGDSVFDTITSAGGGGGGSENINAASGGSGGGGGQKRNSTARAAGGAGDTPDTTPDQGHDGGSGVVNLAASGGGGGSSTAGIDGIADGLISGAGGAGTANSITGSTVYYAGGGGGASGGGTGASGGVGGGGAGGSDGLVGVKGTANTGGGGGGMEADNSGTAGYGGSGIVIIRYLTADFVNTVPTVTTNAATNVEATTATGNGNITDTGGADCDKRGFVYGITTQFDPGTTTPASSDYDSYAEDTGTFSTGAFTKGLTSLTPGTKYYIRAYAHNSAGYNYSDTELDFTTSYTPTLPILSQLLFIPTTSMLKPGKKIQPGLLIPRRFFLLSIMT